MATKAIYGGDLLITNGIDWKAYSKLVGERPAPEGHGRRKADQERMAAARPS
jgi:glutathione S-transferase